MLTNIILDGSPFGPVTHKGVTYVVAHLNNAMLYPGLALGANGIPKRVSPDRP